MPVRNEGWVLPVSLPPLRRFVDGIIALDGHSTDNTVDLLRDHGADVIPQSDHTTNFASWRQTLLEAGRARGGTHFVWIDADEAFTMNLLPTFRERLSVMRPRQALTFDWLCLWKDPRQLRVDDSPWSHNSKDIVFCDDSTMNFPNVRMHESRTPSGPYPSLQIRVPRSEGAVMHFQFAPFHRFQVKQAFVRCREWVLKARLAWEINAAYAITNDSPDARTIPVPPEWLEGIPQLDTLKSDDPGLYLQDIRRYFDEKGAAYFEPLDIWHVPELRAWFEAELHRPPHPMPIPGPLQRGLRRVQRFAQRRLLRQA